MREAQFNPSSLKAFRLAAAAAVPLSLLAGAAPLAVAENGLNTNRGENHEWARGAIEHAQRMRMHKDVDRGAQQTPRIIKKLDIDHDPGGRIASFQPGGATITAMNAFFQDLGTNGRTCFTCHQPQNGWGISAEDVRVRFAESAGTDPIFRLVDGATCPTDDVSTLDAKRQAYSLLNDKGLIRVGLPLPAAPDLEFSVASVDDPYGCITDPATGLTSPTTGIVSTYRRPLPSTNLGFLSTIMWDGRESSFMQQAIDATLGHAQADVAPTVDQQQQMVDFETGIFTAQISDDKAGSLQSHGATGGPVALSQQLAKFFIGVNDPVGLNPTGAPFDPNIFDLFKTWLALGMGHDKLEHRLSIARGEEVFNTTPINITGVTGLNDALNLPSIAGFCGTCHDAPNVGDHSVKAPLNIGIANAGADSPPALDISGLPVLTLQCNSGPLAGQTFMVTDPGRALISGKCADIGKLKGPILRGLASRAPYFHNGSAATLADVVDFYDLRFGIGFTAQEKTDLVNFLNAL